MTNLTEDIGFNARNLKTAEIKVLKVVQGEPTKVFYKRSYKDDFKEAETQEDKLIRKTLQLKRLINVNLK